ncbi:GTPase IMAP family member 7-like [Argopecten irradians]|uniref:GTPase IMAP family member 7-like n=1 Tax=Argopecten irradians TaxID=31199 RepID=UPI003723537E
MAATARTSGSTPSKSELRVLLVGETGCGKSVAGNALLGVDLFTAGAEAKAHPKEKCFRGESQKFEGWDKIVVVDTPGNFFHVSDKDEKTKKEEITKIAGITSPGPHVIILVLSKLKADNRVRENEENILQFYAKSFGKNIENHFVFLFAGEDDDAIAKATIPKSNYLYRLLKETPRNYLAFNASATGKTQKSSKLVRVVSNVVKENGWNFHTDKIFKDIQIKNEERMKELKRQEKDVFRTKMDSLKKSQSVEMNKVKTDMRQKRQVEQKYDTWIRNAETAYKRRIQPDMLTSQVRDEYQNETGIWDTIADITVVIWDVISPLIKSFFTKK